MLYDPQVVLDILVSSATLLVLIVGSLVASNWYLGQVRRRHRAREREELGIVADTPSDGGDPPGPESGGYIVLKMKETEKALFADVLKGFEEFAALRGYRIRFSVDSSVENQIAFKFTLMDRGIGVSTSQVTSDLKDYIDRVRRGEPLDDLPVILSELDHQALLLSLKNRVSFLQHTYNAQCNVIAFYERTFRLISGGRFPVLPPQNFYLQAGGDTMTGDNYAIGQAGAVGPGSTASNFTQVWQQHASSIDLHKLAEELVSVRSSMLDREPSPQRDAVVGALAEAQIAAESNDGPRAMEYLKRAGSWAMDAATQIGAGVAASAISAALGIR